MSAVKTKRMPGTIRALYRRIQRVWSDYGEQLPQRLRKPVLRELDKAHFLFAHSPRGTTIAAIREMICDDDFDDSDDDLDGSESSSDEIADIWAVVKEAEEVLGL